MSFKFIILHTIFFTCMFASPYEAHKITQKEYKKLQAIDNDIYALSVETKLYNTKEVAHFIYRHLGYDLDFTRFTVTSAASIRHSSSDTVYSDTALITDRNSYSASINLSYPLFDKKELNTRKKQIITLKQKIIKEIQNYFQLKVKKDDLKLELKILTALEVRAKARKLDGVGGFTDWLEVIKNIKKTNYDISIADLELKEKKQILMSYIVKNKREILQEML